MSPEEFVIASLGGHDLILSKCLSSVMCNLLGLSCLGSCGLFFQVLPLICSAKKAALDLWLLLRCFYFLKARRNANNKNQVEKLWPAAVLQQGLWYLHPCALLSVLWACLAGLTSFGWRDGCRRSACFGTWILWWLGNDIYKVQK